jgi:uncharacterized protein YcbX
MGITIKKIYRYPVKGLTAETLQVASLKPGQGLELDRRFALTLGSTSNVGTTMAWMPKTAFLTLMRNEKLAKLTANFNDLSGTLSIERGGKTVVKGNITTPIGRAMIEEFFSAYMVNEAQGRPKLVESQPNATLSDHSNAVISVVNLSSVRDLERVTGAEINPIRFRANIYIDGLEPWAEFNWGGGVLIGSAKLSITKRINRCPAINVDPETGERNLNLLKDLKRGFGHIYMGVYAAVTKAGNIAINDRLQLLNKDNQP